MSGFGFSVSDIAFAISYCKNLYEVYSKSPHDYKEFCQQVLRVQQILKMTQGLYRNPQLSTEHRSWLNGFDSELVKLTQDLSIFVKKYEGLANGHGRTRDRIRWPQQEVDHFRKRIERSNLELNTFIGLVPYSSYEQDETSDRYSSEPSLASDERTLAPSTSTLQDACDQSRNTKISLFDRLGQSGISLNAGFGGGPFMSSPQKTVKGAEASREAQRTRSAGEADEPMPKKPKKHSLSWSLGSSSSSLAQVRSPFGQGKM